ncbi:hypothetical protein GCM10010211_20550 [Streptomyces albospinus]|uniref:Uncharacterized protein n=2 Tax=Streptomyces albospinus TaxID=285515 RepID=A0ABQ2UV92_9ACTN|nr:hypothetical protein GCM10010211_20550 [Streptomyces albospinus]
MNPAPRVQRTGCTRPVQPWEGQTAMDEPEMTRPDEQDEHHLACGSILLQEELVRFSSRAMIDDMMAVVSREAMAARLRQQGHGGIG